MSENDEKSLKEKRYTIAIWILGIVTIAITILAIISIIVDPDNAFTIFNTTLPVFASWIGTVLVFYFGKENFESANTEVRKMLEAASSDKMRKPVKEVMKRIADVGVFNIEEKDGENVKLKVLNEKYNDSVTRLPVLNADKSVAYMIHKSSIDQYLLDDEGTHDLNSSLGDFIKDRKSKEKEFGIGKGFVVVSESETIEDAKEKMEAAGSTCQDIFVTKNGGDKEPVTGWISNIRLIKYLSG